MGTSFKQAFLHLSKLLGLFRLSRYLTRRGLRILCYHSFTMGEESLFRAKLFMNCETFRKRLEFLRAQRYPVLSLEGALAGLSSGDLPDYATVITIDDGFYAVYKYACNLLNKFSFPATLYLTTYYCAKERPVFRLVVQYIFWRTAREFFDHADLDSCLFGKFWLLDANEKNRATWEIIRFGEGKCEEKERFALSRRLGQLLDVDVDQIYETRILNLVTDGEVRTLAARGMDVQLHTHRHRLRPREAHTIKEIVDNRAFLEPLLGKRLQHFCYPSGAWCEDFWPWLAAVGIKSAVTCDPGLNYPGTPRLGLKRFLDGENVTQIEFEAELSGYNEILRRARSGLRRFLVWRKWTPLRQKSGGPGTPADEPIDLERGESADL